MPPHSAARARVAWPVAGTLDRVVAHLPAGLVPASARARVGALAAQLPAALTNWLYLECRLAAGASRTDLALLVSRSGRHLLAGGDATPGASAAHPAWSRVQALAGRWADPRDALHVALEGVWLELDAPPSPGRLCDLAPAAFADFADALADAPAPRRAALAERALEPLVGGAVPAGVARTLARALAAAPAHAHLLYAGVMLSRDPPTVRLCVMGVGGPELLPYLRRLGWAGPNDAVARLTAHLAGADPAVSGVAIVHLDVAADERAGGELLPTLGLEYPLSRRAQMHGVIGETGFLDALVALGLCTAAKRAALPQWPGYEIGVLPHELWPSVIVRRVNHVKVALAPDGDAHAKAYLCVHHAARRRPIA